MKKFAAILCIAGSTLALAACETGTTYDSSASFATDRTAGEIDAAPSPVVQTERVFKAAQTK
ncbi:MAG: hypothetical protein KAJ86_01095 [Alphaproteobacteria bacterium]|nr:hypothetical protein [Alphaproteobacteria bacterium]